MWEVGYNLSSEPEYFKHSRTPGIDSTESVPCVNLVKELKISELPLAYVVCWGRTPLLVNNLSSTQTIWQLLTRDGMITLWDMADSIPYLVPSLFQE
jgi:hypothetical protein